MATGLRVLVRAPRQQDRDAFLAAVRASRALHRGWVAPPATPEDFRDYLRRNEGDDYEALLAVERASGAVVGAFNLSQIFRRAFQNAYLGYWGNAAFVGQGMMSEGLGLVLAHAFRRLKLHRVEANIQPGNEASRALVSRAGFRLEGFSPRYLKIGGRWRDHERWALCREDWHPR